MRIREWIIAVAITLPFWVLLLMVAPTPVAAQTDIARMKSDSTGARRRLPSKVRCLSISAAICSSTR